MKVSQNNLVTTGIILFMLLFTTSLRAQDPGWPDTVFLSSVTGAPGGKVVVPVFAFNDEPLAAILVPLKYSSTEVVCDSVSFIGTRVQDAPFLTDTVIQENQEIVFGALMIQPLTAGRGLIANLHFSILPEASPQTVFIDTFVFNQNPLTFGDTSGMVEFTPVFVKGSITVSSDLPPKLSFIPDQYVNEGETLIIKVKATDPLDEAVQISVVNPPLKSTFVDSGGGKATLTWVPEHIGPASSVGSPFRVSFIASDGKNTDRQNVRIFVFNKNALPILNLPVAQTVPAGVALNFQVSATDPDLEPVNLVADSLPPGASFDNQNPGNFSWTPTQSDTGVNWAVFRTTDASGGKKTGRVQITVVSALSYVLSVGMGQAYPGETLSVPITLTNLDSVAGFELLVHYEHTSMTLLTVSKKGTRIENWEHFQPRIGPTGVLGPGDVRIVSIADIPDIVITKPLPAGTGTVAYLKFLISNDQGLGGFLIPVGFEFQDSTDNTLADAKGNLIRQSQITYSNGGVLVLKSEALLGDINLNRLPFEIGDAVRFSNYLINPIVFAFNAQQLANSDVNQDGIPATIADLVFMIKKIQEGTGGGAKQLPLSQAVNYWMVENENYYSVWCHSDEFLGGALLEFEYSNPVIPALSLTDKTSQMNLGFGSENSRLRVLIYSWEGRLIENGKIELLRVSKDNSLDLMLLQGSFADAYGRLLETQMQKKTPENLPGSFRLGQNYPNPFNPETKIEFALASESRVSLKVYNILGELVRTLIDEILPTGTHQVIWEGRNSSGEKVASGVYFYRLEAGSFVETKKMILMK